MASRIRAAKGRRRSSEVDRADLRRLGTYEQVLATFKQYDVDGNGIMSFKEMHRLMVDINDGDWTEAESDSLFTQIDKDFNGAIDIQEFVDWIFGRTTQSTGASDFERVTQEFRRFDRNRNGTLDKAEFTRVMQSLKPGGWSSADTDKVFRNVDKDHSGEVDLDELVAYLFGVPQKRVTQARRASRGKDHGPLVVIEITCGPGGPEVAVQRLANTWGKKFGGQVAVMKIMDKDTHTITRVTARDGKVVFWDLASMVAFRDNPFLSLTTMQDWTNDMTRRHIPRLIEGSYVMNAK